MARTKKAVTCCLLAIIFAVIVSESALAGKTPPPPTNTSPVEYRLTWLGPMTTVLNVTNLNNAGEAIGQANDTDGVYRAVQLTEVSGIQLLDDLCPRDPASGLPIWYDLDAGSYVDGWKTNNGKQINNAGQMVGSARTDGWLRAFLFDEVVGFKLLPTDLTAGAGDYGAFCISEGGCVLVKFLLGGDYNQSPQFYLWTPANPTKLYLLAVGSPGGSTVGLNDNQFLIVNGTTNALLRYSYAFAGESISYSVNATVSLLNQNISIHLMNTSGVFGFTSKEGRNFTAGYFDTAKHTVYSDAKGSGVRSGNVNDAGDFLYAVYDVGYLYRKLDGKTYKVSDLLNAAAKSALSTSTYITLSHVNDSNVAVVPSSDPFDQIVGTATFSSGKRAFILTPYPKP